MHMSLEPVFLAYLCTQVPPGDHRLIQEGALPWAEPHLCWADHCPVSTSACTTEGMAWFSCMFTGTCLCAHSIGWVLAGAGELRNSLKRCILQIHDLTILRPCGTDPQRAKMLLFLPPFLQAFLESGQLLRKQRPWEEGEGYGQDSQRPWGPRSSLLRVPGLGVGAAERAPPFSHLSLQGAGPTLLPSAQPQRH